MNLAVVVAVGLVSGCLEEIGRSYFMPLSVELSGEGVMAARIESEPSSRIKPEIFASERHHMAGNNRGYEYDYNHNRVSKNMKVSWLLSCNFPFKEIV